MSYNKAYDKIENGKKLCGDCGQLKLVDCFNKHYNKISGGGLFKSCIKCKNKAACARNKIRGTCMIDSRILKLEFLIAYGGKCTCCGETEIDLLTIEHIRGKGHELIYGNTNLLIRKLRKLEWPEGYTVLCWNCNLSTKNNRPCPHSKEYKEYKKEFETNIRKDFIKYKYYTELKTKLNSIKKQ